MYLKIIYSVTYSLWKLYKLIIKTNKMVWKMSLSFWLVEPTGPTPQTDLRQRLLGIKKFVRNQIAWENSWKIHINEDMKPIGSHKTDCILTNQLIYNGNRYQSPNGSNGWDVVFFTSEVWDDPVSSSEKSRGPAKLVWVWNFLRRKNVACLMAKLCGKNGELN